MSQNTKFQASRRTFLQASAVTALSTLATPFIRPASAQSRKIVVRDPGGPYALGFREAFYDPFTADTGIEIVNVVAQHGPVNQIMSFVDTGTLSWDMSLLTRGAQLRLTSGKQYLEELNVDPGGVNTDFCTPHFIAVDVIQSVLAFRTDSFDEAAGPTGWADMWDEEKFKGIRSLRRNPQETLEIALLADGVAPDDLYPLDIDRAFASLDKIKGSVGIWWGSGAQASQILNTNEAAMVATFNARAQAAVDEGAPVKLVWNQGLMSPEGWCVLKGSPNLDICQEFIAFTTDAERQAVFTKFLSYGPSNPGAYDHIDAETAARLPTSPENVRTAIMIDDEYWDANIDALTERFNEWLLS